MKSKIVLAGLLFVMATLLYIQTVGFEFISDDTRLIVENPRIKNLGIFWRTLAQPFFAFPDHPYLHYWRPLTLFSYWADYSCWGLNPVGYHLTNVLLNAGVSVLLFLLLLQLSGRIDIAFLAALLFTMHPAHAENVAWISGRTDLLSSFFLLLGALLLSRYFSRRRPLFYPAALLSFCLALAAKEFAILAPALVFLWMLLRREPFRRALYLSAPFLGVAILYGVLHNRIAHAPSLLRYASLSDIPLIVKTVGAYVKILLLPFFPAPYFSMTAFDADHWQYYLLAVFFLPLLLFIIWRKKSFFPCSLLALPLLVFLLPVLDPTLVPSYPKIALRFVYLPAILPALLGSELFLLARRKVSFPTQITSGAEANQRKMAFVSCRGKKIVVTVFFVLLLIVWTGMTWNYQKFFRAEKEELQWLIRIYPEESVPFYALSIIKAREGDYAGALTLANQGLQTKSRWLELFPRGKLLKANLLLALNRIEEGRKEIDTIKYAAGDMQHQYYRYFLLALYHEKKRDFPAALRQLEQAEKLGQTADLCFRKALILVRLNRYDEAIRHVEKARALEPDLHPYARFRAYIEQRRLQPRR